MKYQDLKAGIRSHLEDVAEDFFMVGYFLRQISENALFTEDGYKSIWEFAKGEYGLSTSSASRFMAINARFSIDGGEHMAEKYIGMGVSKLQEMLGLPDEELEKVTQETTVREIRAMKKKQEAPRSFYGFPKTERPEGSLLTTPGCGDGKYDCFNCARPCGIRQEERHCRTATCGNPFPCTQMGEEKRLDIEAGLFSEKCQHLHPELAPIREGDKEPDPCCLTCEHKTCFSRCDVAKKRDEDERKKEQAERQKQQREAEAKKPEMGDNEMKALYKWFSIKTDTKLTGAALKEQHGKSYHGGSSNGIYFNCSPRGVRTNHSQEMTWGEIAKHLAEIQEAEKKKADFVERSNGAQKNVRDLIKQQDEKRQQKAEEKKAAQKQKEDGRLLKFYKDIYPGTRQIIAQRDKAAITKEFKTIYGSTYENGKGWMCYPDKIVFKDSPDAEQIQITWGRFTTKLVELLDRFPETERSILLGDATKEKEPEVIDADFREVEDSEEPKPITSQEPEPVLCDTCEHEGECAGKKTHENGCMGYEEKTQEPEAEAEPNPEEYARFDVESILKKEKGYLDGGREADCPAKFIKEHKIIVDALTLLLEKMDAEGGAED